MVDELDQKKVHYKAIATNIASAICHFILRLYGVEVKNPDHIEICNKFYIYVEQNYQSDINLDTFADNVYVSKYHFIHMFKEATGISPMKYLHFVRLSAAKDLLGSTEMPVQEIAASIGYNNAQSFSRAFKNSESISPTEYRENVRDYSVPT
jgi:transcriptional regulator GlxA family with amidase domain